MTAREMMEKGKKKITVRQAIDLMNERQCHPLGFHLAIVREDMLEKADMFGGDSDGLHWALYVIECQDKFISWDSKKKLLKLLQPEQSDFDWSIVNAMLEGLSDMLPNTNNAHGGDWLKDWLKDFMWEYGLDPADLLMEEKDEGTDSV